jgi:acetate kinase
VLREIEAAAAFAPLHDPQVLKVIHAGMERFPAVPHFACFDTVFHETMPEEATTYAIPAKIRERGVRRYGFHGLSCESVVRQMQQRLGAEHLPRRLAIAHLGSGCSVTAVLDGKSIDTTMGLTPTGGVVMGTRPGDLDPGLMLYLLRQQKDSRDEAAAALEQMLNHDAGLVAVSGMKNDVKAMRAAADVGDAQATLALRIFARSVTKALGAFFFLMCGLDAIVFAGGIGEHDAATRAEVLAGLDALGIQLAVEPRPTEDEVCRVSTEESAIAVYVVPADEDETIAMHVMRMAQDQSAGTTDSNC